MTRPIRLGLMYSYREGWIGGSYYLLNLISALKRLDKRDRPDLTVLAFADNEIDQVRALDYPGATYRVLHEPSPGPVLSLANRVTKKLIGRLVKLPPAIQDELDIIYPAGLHARYRNISQRLFWIPDFQEEYLPEMFGKQKVENRRNYRGRVARSAEHIVFSSQDAASDFRRFYPESSAQVHVLNFAVTHPDYKVLDVESLRKKFSLGNAAFFLVSNQFWKHKNHPLVIEALNHLIDSSNDEGCLVCFSGKEQDGRNPEYASGIRAMVAEHHLQDRVRFLGFIDRAEQLALMKASSAVIQPSLFEGWSTVIEDAKALSVPVIASDLAVHQEQLGGQGIFFDRADSTDLAGKMGEQLQSGAERKIDQWSYDQRVEAFGRNFVEILQRVLFESSKDQPHSATGHARRKTSE